ncbi:hypothetical protein IWT25_00734 [Secundilactobacillus pentosiphilus]|uniref:Uncharacterized protein n=1 Tax=Secundilactobacillus pentosiphilus TaxID=1714682 RepID=A0A1Z5IUI2_9LACO|nr:hypothetical protein [Secundilactobacillus pentosiphilus]GAX05430.1 hypothetical protein IWT25_00734 [Secundilactobacillus pentosiphilus]
MIKAYAVTGEDWDYGETGEIVWAENANKAKAQLALAEVVNEAEYVDLRAIRAPWADGMEHMNKDKFCIEMLKHGWRWYLGDVGPDISIDETAIPVLKKVGSIEAFASAFDKGQLTYDRDNEEWKFNETN